MIVRAWYAVLQYLLQYSTIHEVHLEVILIWWFGDHDFGFDYQI